MNGKCILLCRVSTDRQSLDSQINELVKQAKSDGYTDSQIIKIENKESAVLLRKEEMQGIQELTELIQSDKSINAVYAYEVSRLSRHQADIMQIRDFFINYKIQLVLIKPFIRLLNEEFQMTMEANLMFSIYSSMAETESDLRKARCKRGRDESRYIRKTYTGGFIPFGYKVAPDKHLVPDEKDADTVRLIFKMYSEEEQSSYSIADYMIKNRLMRVTSGILQVSRWILAIIHNPVYKGSRVEYPALVSEEQWEKVNAKVAARKGNRGKEKVTYKHYPLCKDLLFDAAGLKMYYDSADSTYKSLYNKQCSEKIIISYDFINRFVWHLTKTRLKGVDNTSGIELLQANINSYNAEIQGFISLNKTIEEKMDRINKMYINGRISEKNYNAEYKACENEKAEIVERDFSVRMKIVEAEGEIEKLRKQTDGGLSDSLIEQDKQKLVRQVISKIIIQKHGYHVYTLTMTFTDNSTEIYHAENTARKRGFTDSDGKSIDL